MIKWGSRGQQKGAPFLCIPNPPPVHRMKCIVVASEKNKWGKGEWRKVLGQGSLASDRVLRESSNGCVGKRVVGQPYKGCVAGATHHSEPSIRPSNDLHGGSVRN
jgi:hypothetical protein